MRILVDTSIWSLALRKNDRTKDEGKIIEYFTEIIRELKLIIIGPIRQEILSGISDRNKFEELRNKISVFEDHEIDTNDYELAAQLFKKCRSNGVQGSHIDFLICAVSINNQMSILTLDKDFDNYKSIIPIKIEKIG